MVKRLLSVLNLILVLSFSTTTNAQSEVSVISPTFNIGDAFPKAQTNFAQAVAMSSDHLFISKYSASSITGKAKTGIVYIYNREDQGWVLKDSILSPLDEEGICFGYKLAANGDRLVVGSSESFITSRTKDGFVSVFKKDAAGKWNPEVAVLRPKSQKAGALWGSAVAIDGDVMAVGSSLYKNGTVAQAGTAHIFEYSAAGGWEEKLDNTPEVKARMGRTVAVHGNKVVLSSTELGAFVYEKENGTWIEKDRLDLTTSDNYYGISIEDQTILAGDFSNQKVLVYGRNDAGKWIRKQELPSPEGVTTFGANITLKGNHALISTTNKGVCYIFRRDAAGVWAHFANLKYDDDLDAFQFGFATDFNGKEAIIGRQGYKENNVSVGRAHYYNLTNLVGTGTGLADVKQEELVIKSAYNGIIVTVSAQLPVSVYSIDGQLVTMKRSENHDVVIPLSKGIYVIKAGSEIRKIVL